MITTPQVWFPSASVQEAIENVFSAGEYDDVRIADQFGVDPIDIIHLREVWEGKYPNLQLRFLSKHTGAWSGMTGRDYRAMAYWVAFWLDHGLEDSPVVTVQGDEGAAVPMMFCLMVQRMRQFFQSPEVRRPKEGL